MQGDKVCVNRNFSVAMVQKKRLTSEAQDSQKLESILIGGFFLIYNVTSTLPLQVHYQPRCETERWPKGLLSTLSPAVLMVLFIWILKYEKNPHSTELAFTRLQSKESCSQRISVTWRIGFTFYKEYQKQWSYLQRQKSYLEFVHTVRNLWDAVKPQRNFWSFLCLIGHKLNWKPGILRVLPQRSKLQAEHLVRYLVWVGERDCSMPETHPSRVSFCTLNLKAFQSRCLSDCSCPKMCQSSFLSCPCQSRVVSLSALDRVKKKSYQINPNFRQASDRSLSEWARSLWQVKIGLGVLQQHPFLKQSATSRSFIHSCTTWDWLS